MNPLSEWQISSELEVSENAKVETLSVTFQRVVLSNSRAHGGARGFPGGFRLAYVNVGAAYSKVLADRSDANAQFLMAIA
jgi:hypothetical protein